ncbi:MAG: DbpA RNA binding domain-containing protein, partial [Ruminococcus sp.]|nr:DbpA RNA binding domain-containing protein [Ruminococcus sp.]
LVKAGFRAAGLHGDMKQAQRTQVMNSFKAKNTAILVATDVAARGIDVSGVDAVFNYDLPQDNEYYIHRIGRTGRAGRAGAAYSIISGRKQLYELKAISRYVKADIKELPLPDKSDIIAMKKESIVRSIAAQEERPSHDAYEILDRLAAEGIDYREAAARLVSGKLADEIAGLPELDVPKPIRKGKRSGAKTVRIDLNIGRNKRIAPNFILGALVDATGMSGQDFGKIDIFDSHTTVEVPEAETDFILDAANPMKINGNPVEVKLFKGDTSGEKSGRGGFSSKNHRSDHRPDHRPDRRRSAYGSRKKADIFSDYIPDRRKRSKKRS